MFVASLDATVFCCHHGKARAAGDSVCFAQLDPCEGEFNKGLTMAISDTSITVMGCSTFLTLRPRSGTNHVVAALSAYVFVSKPWEKNTNPNLFAIIVFNSQLASCFRHILLFHYLHEWRGNSPNYFSNWHFQ